MISIISLAVVFYLVDLHKLADALRLADYRIVVIAFMLSLLWLAVRGRVWRVLLQDKATLNQTFLTINEGYLLNNILPFRLGEVARAFLLGRKASLEFWGVFSTIIIERTMDLAMAAGVLLSTLPFVIGASWARQAALVAVGIVCLGLGALYLMARYRDGVTRQIEKLTVRWSLLQKLASRHLPAFLSGLAVLTDGRLFLRAILWMLLNWVIAVGQYYAFMWAFFPHAKLLWAAFCLGVVSLGIAAPSSPGAIGVLELSTVGALSLFDLDTSTALALALTTHLANYLITGVLGAYALARDGETLTGLFQRLRRLPQK
jgi:uncharacterized protein (TIRG00374 family)